VTPETFRTLFVSLSRKVISGIYAFVSNIEKFHLLILNFGKLMGNKGLIPRFCVGLQILSCMPRFKQSKHGATVVFTITTI
jgi:hypothetical protein